MVRLPAANRAVGVRRQAGFIAPSLEPISVGADSPVSGGQAVAATIGSAACAWRRFQRDIDLICLHGQAFIALIAKASSSTHINYSTRIR